MTAELTLHSLPIGVLNMDNKERQTMREHIIYLANQLEITRRANQQQIVFIKRILDPEDLGHAVSNECRQIAYTLLINSSHQERDSWQHQENN
jgi:hypothetical protein